METSQLIQMVPGKAIRFHAGIRMTNKAHIYASPFGRNQKFMKRRAIKSFSLDVFSWNGWLSSLELATCCMPKTHIFHTGTIFCLCLIQIIWKVNAGLTWLLCFPSKFENFRKRSLSDSAHDDMDNTRDSVLSDQSHFSAELANYDPELIIIDFEYCAYNYRAFDLANHFIEWTLDYTNKSYPFYYYKKEQYPTQEQQVSQHPQEKCFENWRPGFQFYHFFSLDLSVPIWLKYQEIQTTHQQQLKSKGSRVKFCASQWPHICSGLFGRSLTYTKTLNSDTG